MRSLLAALVCAMAYAATAAGQTPYNEMMRDRAEADIVRYQAMLTAYAAGDDTRGLDALLQWDRNRLESALGFANSTKDPFAPWDQRRYGLAVMLHTDAALRISENVETKDAFAQVDTAAKLLQMGTRLEPDLLRPLAQRWYFTLSRYLRDRNAPYAAGQLLAGGRERLRDDPVVLYESGTLAESLATDYALADRAVLRPSYAGRDVGFSATFERRTGHLNDAAKWLRSAAALDPGNDLPRLHLGRVHALRLDDDDALRVLGDVLDKVKDDATASLAAVFIGGVRERQLRLDDAASAYRTAIARFPTGHAAYIGLSEVLQRSGKGDESREVLRTLLDPGVGPTREPRWWYQFEPNGVADERLAALRAEVRR